MSKAKLSPTSKIRASDDNDAANIDKESASNQPNDANNVEEVTVEEVTVALRRLEILPHAELSDKRAEIVIGLKMVDDDENEVGKENLSDCVFISSSSKPKGNGIYTYKKQSVTLKLGKTIKFYAMDSRDQSKSIFDGVLHTQNFMEGDFEGIDQQISLTTVGSEESSAYLMVSILTDKDEAETHSYSSKNSRRSLKNRRKHKGGHPAPSLQEESFEDIREDDLDDDMDDAGDAGEDPFIKYEDTKTKLKKFEDGDGFDVFVDAARFLPDNATVTKISVKAYSKSGKAVGGDEKIGYCDLGSALLNPKFSDCRKEFRGDKFDPTATLMVRLDTFEEDIQKVRAVGYGLLNLFTMLDDRKKQVSE